MTSTDTLIRRLADRAELEDLVALHTLWIDEGRWDETDRLFTADVAVKSLRGEVTGIDDLVAMVRAGHDAFEATLHSKANLVIELDGDTATVRANDLAIFAVNAKEEALAAGIHHYTARRTEDGWRFDSLRVVPFALTESLTRAL